MNIKDCGNCHKAIMPSNFLPHEAYCYRHYTYCTKCTELIRKTDLYSHNQKFHARKTCLICYESFEAVDLPYHLLSCENSDNNGISDNQGGISDEIRDVVFEDDTEIGNSIIYTKGGNDGYNTYLETNESFDSTYDMKEYKESGIDRCNKCCKEEVQGFVGGQVIGNGIMKNGDMKPIKKIKTGGKDF